jgi:zinc transport system permease protein
LIGELLSYTFMQRAFLASALVGTLCSTVAFFVVLRRMAFLGVGISHAALGGIALGLVTGINPAVTGSIFALAVALATGQISRRGRISEDTTIGILYAAGMAFGIALISVARGYHPDLFSLLFGNILAVSPQDLQLMLVVALLVLLFLILFFKELLAISFDEEMARAAGLPVSSLYLGLLAAIALTVIVSVKLAGAVLVSALLVIPGATGYRLSSNYRGMLILSLATGLAGSLGGLLLSYYTHIPAGAAMVLVMTLLFLLALAKKPGRPKIKTTKEEVP